MTKETKIGLLVGLAFIVLFAIILSERGTSHRESKAPAFAFMDQSKKSSNVISDQPLGDMGRVPVENQLAPIVRPSTTRVPVMAPVQEERVVQNSSRADEPLEELPVELVNSLNLPRVVDPSVHETPIGSTSRIALDGASKVSPTGDSRTVTSPLSTRTDALASGVKTDKLGTIANSSSDSGGAKSSPPSQQELDRIAKQVGIRTRSVHEVQPGESLGKIAAKYYGRSTPARVDALFEANRDVLKDRASVKAKTSLRIPDLGEGFEPAPEFIMTDASKSAKPVSPNPSMASRSGKSEASPLERSKPVLRNETAGTSPTGIALRIPVPIGERDKVEGVHLASTNSREENVGRETAKKRTDVEEATSKGKPMAFRWYEVQRNDTLSRIARRELGGEKHVKRLYEINQDLLKSRNTLKPGMKLRVPATITGSTELNTQSARSNGDGEP